jgi:hypothetical protein
MLDVHRTRETTMTGTLELLDQAPLAIARPLALLHGRAYAAAWPYVRPAPSANAESQTAAAVVPAAARQALWVLRDDGVAFGDGAGQPLAALGALGLDLRLGDRPPSDRLWSTPGLQAYRRGVRPNPLDVFERMAAVVDRFIDFDRSLAPQRTMTEFVAAYALSTWLLDAFGVVGFLWPSGDRGSGKTNLLHVVTQLSYLGTVLTAGGSFASLRDLADYGATLAFDDAEQLAEGGKGDPDKRALLLAGNRRGAVVTLKELAAGGQRWQTRYLNAYCPRLFSAIRLPDPVLASRSIVVPLVRTADRARANADPLDFAAWPHDRQALVDDLWALALANLPELPAFDAQVARQARLAGRTLQPWRAVLAVALWLEHHGQTWLHARLEQLALAYQSERPDLEAEDLSTLVVKALLVLYTQAARRALTLSPGPLESFHVRMAELIPVVEALADMADMPRGRLTAHRLGFILNKLRVSRDRLDGKYARQWLVRRDDLKRWTVSYGLRVEGTEGDHEPNAG